MPQTGSRGHPTRGYRARSRSSPAPRPCETRSSESARRRMRRSSVVRRGVLLSGHGFLDRRYVSGTRITSSPGSSQPRRRSKGTVLESVSERTIPRQAEPTDAPSLTGGSAVPPYRSRAATFAAHAESAARRSAVAAHSLRYRASPKSRSRACVCAPTHHPTVAGLTGSAGRREIALRTGGRPRETRRATRSRATDAVVDLSEVRRDAPPSALERVRAGRSPAGRQATAGRPQSRVRPIQPSLAPLFALNAASQRQTAITIVRARVRRVRCGDDVRAARSGRTADTAGAASRRATQRNSNTNSWPDETDR